METNMLIIVDGIEIFRNQLSSFVSYVFYSFFSLNNINPAVGFLRDS